MAERSRSIPRKKPRQERSRATVDAILEAAAHILVEHGYESTTTRQVAERAGVSIGSLYQYFPSKEALVTALVERQLQAVMDTCAEALRHPDGLRTEEVARHAARGLVKAYGTNPRLQQVLVAQGLRLGMMERMQEMEKRLLGEISLFMLRHREKLRPQRAELAAFVVARAVRGVIWAAAAERPELFEDPALVDELSELMLGYLLP